MSNNYSPNKNLGEKTSKALGCYQANGSVLDRNTGSVTRTSIFDPVLCEVAYSWFCPPGGKILDPFAGGSVRGIVANKLGYEYTGIDLRNEQIESNIEQAKEIIPGNIPNWLVGDSSKIVDELDDSFDFIFSCPPYGDLEIYSDSLDDLSNMDYGDFKRVYFDIVKSSVSKLADDSFAVFVVGDFRDKDGNYRNFVSHTIEAFLESGCHLYNDVILLTAIGSLPIRAGAQFKSSRKLGKAHQNVLVFTKGNAKDAAKKLGEVNIRDIAYDEA